MYLPSIGTAFKSLFRPTRRSSGSEFKKMGKRRTSAYSHRVETLVLTTPLDIERAMSAVTLPRRVDIQASLLSHSKGASVEKLLKRVGCLELCIQGKSAAAPRRVFEHEVVATISHIKQHKLKKLILKNLDLQRLESENADGEEATAESPLKKGLKKLIRLEEFHLQSCRLDAALEDMLRAADTLPRLKEVTINLTDDLENKEEKALMVDTMTSLLQRPQITSLAISEFPQDESFWKQIAVSKTLTHLSMSYRHDMSDQQHYWDLLQSNSSIEQLELQVKSGTSLKSVMELLKKNTTITSLLLHLEEDPTCVSQQLTEVLEYQNFTLQTIHLLCHNIYGYKVRVPSPRLDFFTKLNRQGRRHLLGIRASSRTSFRQPKEAEWVDAMATNTYDVSSTYYWLRSNPNLFTMP